MNDPIDLRGASLTRRGFVVGGAMALTSAAAYAAKPRKIEHDMARRKLGDMIGRTLGPWTITTPAGVIVPTEELENKDGYDQVLTRVYQAPGKPTIMLLIAYGSTQGGTLQLHRPETCYPGQGFALRDFEDTAFHFPGGVEVPARRFTGQRGDRTERLVYWTRIGRHFPRNTAQEYAAIIANVVRGVVPDGILIRLSTTSVDGMADPALDEFAQLMIGGTNALGRQMLLGAA